MADLHDLEDDIELPPVEIAQIEEPRKLSRLKKKKIDENKTANKLQGLDTPESEVRGSRPDTMLADEENEAEDSPEDDAEADPSHDDPAGENAEGAEEEGEEEQEDHDGAEVWDEEDEIERYFQEKSENGRGGEDSGSDGSGSDSDEDYDSGTAAKKLGDNPSLQDLNAETQRILRETAARDRLGKGQKIEIKPLTGIAAKLKQRRELAIARAPKPRAGPTAPTFDDILLAKDEINPLLTTPRAKTKDTGISGPKNGEDAGNGNQSTPVATAENQNNQDSIDLDGDLDLEVLSDDDEAGHGLAAFQVVDLPGAKKAELTPKRSPLLFDPFSQNRDIDEFEDEPLIDDGLNSDDESDSESDRSWEVRKDDEGKHADGEEEEVSGGGGRSGTEDSDGDDSSSDAEEDGQGMDVPMEDIALGSVANEGAEETDAGDKVRDGGDVPANAAKPSVPSAVAMLLAASDAVPNKVKKMKRRYLDTEAELSDEEGGGMVSDDEDEDGMDDNGELTDLITTEKVKAKDIEAAEEAHVQWARKKDAEDLQKVLRGLDNGFRRPRFGGSFDDGDDEIHGRLRRARYDGDDFGDLSAAFAFPSGFGVGAGADDEEECEDEEMLKKAREQRLLAGSQGIHSPDAIPLDEDSQAMLGMLARSASESQPGFGPMCPPPSRLARDLGHSMRRGGPSFVGRQSAVVRSQGAGGLGLTGGRSFVFGRSENSNSAMAPEAGAPQGQTEDAANGPVSFANLKQMAGIPGSAVGQDGGGKKKKGGAPTLVEKLKSKCSGSMHGSQDSLNAVSAVCQTIAMGRPNKVQRR